MHITAKKQQGGSTAAKPTQTKPEAEYLAAPADAATALQHGHTTSDDIGPRPAFNEFEHNDCDDTDPESTTRCRSWDDVVYQESYNDVCHSDDPSNYCIRTFEFGPYGSLRTVIINREAWCSLTDAARIAGCSIHNITGVLLHGYHGFAHVRGWAGYLEPDGVRRLDKHGVVGIGIRLEALRRVCSEARGGGRLAQWLEQAILHVYSAESLGADHGRSIQLAGLEVLPEPQPGKFWQHRFYDYDVGEFRTIIIGTEAWVNISDIVRYTLLEEKAIVQIVGQPRMVSIPNSAVANADEPEGIATYVLFDALFKLLNATVFGNSTADSLERWISENLLSPDHQKKVGMTETNLYEGPITVAETDGQGL